MNSVILLMAGKGTRMKENINKVLLPLKDKQIYQYALELFLKNNFEVICVISKDDEALIDKTKYPNVKYVIGGETRAHSVYNGLKCCSGDYVLVHDAARALLDQDTLDNIINSINDNEAILTYLEVKDTIKDTSDNKLVTLKRDKLIAASTPQCAPYKYLYNSYKLAFDEGYSSTDDISLIEKYYPDINIKLIKANENSFKITTQLDYKLAKLLVEEQYD